MIDSVSKSQESLHIWDESGCWNQLELFLWYIGLAKARLSQEAWRRSMDASDLARGEVMSLRTTVLGQISEIRELHAADRRRQAVTSEMLKADDRRSAKMIELRIADPLQGHVIALQGQQGPAGGPAQPELQRSDDSKNAPKTSLQVETLVTTTPAPTTTTTTSVTNAQLQAMIDQGVTAALAARDANRNGDDSHTSGMGGRRTERVARECTYQDFMKCQPLYFKGTKGVVELTQWFERMETVFHISNCSMENHIKFSTCTLLAVKGTDVIGYNQRFLELALLCVRMFHEESDKIESQKPSCFSTSSRHFKGMSKDRRTTENREIKLVMTRLHQSVCVDMQEQTQSSNVVTAQIQDKVFVITSLKNDLRKMKGKEIVDIAAQIPSANTIVPGIFKLDLEPLAPILLQNRESHIDYLKYTQEQADILWEIAEQAKAE
ncbi:hypothetical protein Tco_1362233 [Tanacetum coccineum]